MTHGASQRPERPTLRGCDPGVEAAHVELSDGGLLADGCWTASCARVVSMRQTAVVLSESPRRPSETARGRAWLSNFAEQDRAPAKLLLDSLQIVSPLAMQLALRAQLADLAK